MKMRGYVWLAAVLSCIAGPVLAHHSQAMFDETKMVTLTGKVTKFSWINPHVQLYVDVPDKGKTESWQMELNSALTLGKAGWKRTQYKPGDTVTVSFHPMRNGTKIGYLRKVVGPDGKEFTQMGNTPTAAQPPSGGAPVAKQ